MVETFFTLIQTGPAAHPASCNMGTGSFLGPRRPRRGIVQPPYLSPRLKKEWSYISTPHLGLRVLLQGELWCDSERSVHSVARLRTGWNLSFIFFLCLQKACLTLNMRRSSSPGNEYVEFIRKVSFEYNVLVYPSVRHPIPVLIQPVFHYHFATDGRRCIELKKECINRHRKRLSPKSSGQIYQH